MDPVIGFREEDLKGWALTDSLGHWTYHAKGPIEVEFIKNAARFLEALKGTPYVPEYYPLVDKPKLMQTGWVQPEKVSDEVAWRRNCARLLLTLRSAKIRHGDLTVPNILVVDNSPVVLDWFQSKFEDDPGPDKRPEGDAYHLWRSALARSPDTSRHLRRWIAIREHVAGGSLLDLGTAEGDFCLFHAAENNNVVIQGYDKNPEAIEFAKNNWGHWINFKVGDIGKILNFHPFDSVLFLLVYADLFQEDGQRIADQILDDSLPTSRDRQGQMIFETQLAGDGPGPDIFQTDSDVFDHLRRFVRSKRGSVQHLARIKNHDSPGTRSLWKVVK